MEYTNNIEKLKKDHELHMDELKKTKKRSIIFLIIGFALYIGITILKVKFELNMWIPFGFFIGLMALALGLIINFDRKCKRKR